MAVTFPFVIVMVLMIVIVVVPLLGWMRVVVRGGVIMFHPGPMGVRMRMDEPAMAVLVAVCDFAAGVQIAEGRHIPQGIYRVSDTVRILR